MTEGNPFNDIRALLGVMPSADADAMRAVDIKLKAFAGPSAPIGVVDDAVKWLAGWQHRAQPGVTRPLIAVFAGAHQVAGRVHDREVVFQAQARVKSLSEGAAGVRGIAASLQAAFKVFEMGIEYPAADFTKESSLSERECAAAIAFGMEVVAEGADIIVIGNAGFGAATAAAAIARGLYGGAAEYWSGGEGDVAKRRIEAVEAGADLHKDRLKDPLEILRAFGGRDIAGMVGAILAARHQSIPIVLDGFVSTAAAAVLHALNPDAISHCYAGHVSAEPGHGALLDRLDLTPLLSLGIGVGDGSGGTMALGVIRAATAALDTLADSQDEA